MTIRVNKPQVRPINIRFKEPWEISNGKPMTIRVTKP
jgi:hypothetical protein